MPEADPEPPQQSSPKIEYEVTKLEFSESEQQFRIEILKKTTTVEHTVQSVFDEEDVETENRTRAGMADQEHTETVRGGEREADIETGASPVLDVDTSLSLRSEEEAGSDIETEGGQELDIETSLSLGSEERAESDVEIGAGQVLDIGTSLSLRSEEQAERTSDRLSEDSSTQIRSASSELRSGIHHGDGSESDTESTRLDAKTRWAFLDESQQEVDDLNEEAATEGLQGPGQPELAFSSMQNPDVPPSIMEQVSIIARQRPDSLTDEEYQDFLKKPLDEQRRSLKIFFDFLESQGPWYGVKRRVSQEKISWNFENDQ